MAIQSDRRGNVVETPGTADFAAARRRHQLAVEAYTPGTIAIAGQSGVSAAVRSMGRTWEIIDGGRREIERLVVLIDKRELDEEPELGAVLTWQSREFKVAEVSGRSEYETSWLLRCLWMPGI